MMVENIQNKQIWRGWDVVERIGSGAFSDVYKIKKDDNSGDFYSALKVISVPKDHDEYRVYRADGYDDESITQIFKSQVDDLVKEFKLMARFRGTANVVSYEDHMIVPKEDGIGWNVLIRMELLTPLPEYYSKTPLDEKATLKLGVDICRALELCEKFNIVHRDIKPQNIFVNDFGDFKLGDFGVARAMEHTTHATKTGTYSYMAPEVYHGEKYNCSADMYSLGLVLYWLLNERRLPFVPLPPTVPTPSQNSEAQSRRFGGETLPPPLHGSDRLKNAVLKACAFNPAERYKTAEEMGAALNRLLLQMTDGYEQSQKPTEVECETADVEEQTAMVTDEAKPEPKAETDENKTVLILKKREEQSPLVDQPAAVEEVVQPVPETDKAEDDYTPEEAAENIEQPADYTAYVTGGKGTVPDNNTCVAESSRLTSSGGNAPKIKVGSYITFGHYIQSCNASDGKQDIEWLVLDVQDGKALVISKYALDCQPYNIRYTDVTWETCTLRHWLNIAFYNSAFSPEEKTKIQKVTVSADNNTVYNTYPGKATKDKVFLLSIKEAEKYFSSNDARRCVPTKYAEEQNAFMYEGGCWWWLRSPGFRPDYAASVYYVGGIREFGYYVYNDYSAVRPAMWIELDS